MAGAAANCNERKIDPSALLNNDGQQKEAARAAHIDVS
jgi:hypothetical protein